MIAVLVLLVAACRVGDAPTTTGQPTTTTIVGETSTTQAGGIDALVEAARAEGNLNTIGLPRDYCNYGGVIEAFTSKYGLEVNELAPDAGSAEGLGAIRTQQGSSDEQAPDVVDIRFTLGPEARSEGLFQQYKVTTWDSIPDYAKDPDGFWYGGYYGVMAFEVNAGAALSVPSDWSDLLDPQYRGMVALAGDPRVSNQAILAVYAAALANGGSLDDPQPGLDYFAELNGVGNLGQVIAESASIAAGQTPVAIRWTYNALPNRDVNAGTAPIEVLIPTTGRLAGVQVQAISAFAPHPNAARLWMEYLYSDEGQLGWLEGHCYPIRYDGLVAEAAIPADLAAHLPELSDPVFPTVEQLNAATELITAGWDAVVGAELGG
jgi:putative spermidine/putrescine transport system substrate-binding protein